MKTGLKKHYHWVIAVIVFLEMIVYGGLINAIGIYTVPITEELGVGRGAYTVAGIPYGLFSLVSTLLTGALLPKLGYKRLTVISLIITAAGYVSIGLAGGLVGHAIGRGFIGLGYGMCFTAGSVWIIKKWFHKHLGLVIGIISMASGLGGSLMTLILSRLIVAFGWRTAVLIGSLLPIAVSVLYLLVYNAPEDIDLKPYGMGQMSTKQLRKENLWVGHTLKELYRNPLFYIMCFATLLSNMCVYTTSSVINPHFQDNGYSATAAANYDSVLMLTLAFFKLLMGWVSDRFGAKPVAILCLSFSAIGQWLLSNVSDPTLSYVAVVLFSIGLCLTTVAIPLIALPLFGTRGSAEINGIIIGMVSLASLITPPICNFIYDKIGTYSPSFKVAAVLEVFLIGIYFIMFAMASKDRKKELEAQK